MKTTTLGHNDFVCELLDVDCGSTTPAERARIKELLFEHRVLVIRGQSLSPEAYLGFMKSMGAPVRHVLQDLTVPGFPDVLKISDHVLPDGTPTGVLDGGAYWHSDMSYLPALGIATSLYAVRACERSGGTGFLDLTRGLRLIEEDAELLRLLGCRNPRDVLEVEVVHRFGNRHALRDESAPDQKLSDRQHRTLTGSRHRLVERHPVTGAASLFATSGSAMEIAGIDEERSTLALDLLEKTLLAALEVYTHRYEPGDLVIWDNMSTLHQGVGVSPTIEVEESRLLHRINVNYTEENR
ncbi:TauD/TfdA family dioxygenase [Actinocorallia sp. B10E7]|uniref:TauD/TfdA dioxygenase family protein n=1 Tax=Actinocorallia sp. B10E7 TaxID=3153558 RepID=UPI00325DB5EC